MFHDAFSNAPQVRDEKADGFCGTGVTSLRAGPYEKNDSMVDVGMHPPFVSFRDGAGMRNKRCRFAK